MNFFGAHPLVGVLAVAHGAVFFTATPGFLLKKKSLVKAGLVLLVAAFVLNTAIILDRWIEGGRPPFKTLFETLLFYPWCVGAVTLLLIAMHKLKVLLPFAGAICLGGLLYGLYKPDVEIINLPPALQSAWFVPHVITYFVAYAALFASCVLALLSLFAPNLGREGGEESEAVPFDEHAHLAVKFGFAALSLGLVLGAVWGKSAWGDYWTWDPKENWALVTWLAYLVYLHVRYVKGWNGRRAMALCALSFAAVVFTYLGMSLLPTAEESLHVYQ